MVVQPNRTPFVSERRRAEAYDPSNPLWRTRRPKGSHDPYEFVKRNEFVMSDNVMDVSVHDEDGHGVVRKLQDHLVLRICKCKPSYPNSVRARTYFPTIFRARARGCLRR